MRENNVGFGSFSKLSDECRKCPFVKKCKNKRMQHEGYIIPKIAQPMAQPMIQPMIQTMANPMAVKHDYRNIKVAENTTVTIDIEELKRQNVENFYKQLKPGINYGA